MEPIALSALFILATKTFNLPENLLSSLCYVESTHNIAAVHKDDGNGNSLGLCQIKLSTAKIIGFKGKEKDLMNPKINSYFAAKYLRKQIDRYHGDIRKAVGAYNSGTYRENTKKFPINQKYINKVFKAWLEKK